MKLMIIWSGCNIEKIAKLLDSEPKGFLIPYNRRCLIFLWQSSILGIIKAIVKYHAAFGKDGQMSIKQTLPIGIDDFRKIREGDYYYIDKTLMIQDFIELRDMVTLIIRPRRFGKTLNMTMIRDFFDITQDSRNIFEGLNIMNTAHAEQINSRPVIYLTFKDCKGSTPKQMFDFMNEEFYREYRRYELVLKDNFENSYDETDFYRILERLQDGDSADRNYGKALLRLMSMLKTIYKIEPILVIDEYDQPIISSYEHGYHDQLGDFFSNLYGSAMESNPTLGQALLTGVQRVAKESIFSQFNNAIVYTVLDREYASYFGLTIDETAHLLADYGMNLDETVQKKYNGYRFGNVQMYNPWSILSYAKADVLKNYWINTSSNYLVKQALAKADREFWDDFDRLVMGEQVSVLLTLETSYVERGDNYSLWGLLVNAGYLTALERVDEHETVVKIPNEEVLSEFQAIITSMSGIKGLDLKQMFTCLQKKDMDGFICIYQKIVIACTSYMDAKENSYHMLFLGMCMTLRDAYEVQSNMESGHGRSDIILKSLHPTHSHMIIEFKHGEANELKKLAGEALNQIKKKEYYAALKGEIICIGIAHDKKHCEMVYETILL